MSNNDNYTRCKQCGKVIVGGGKMGLCDSCFNADAEKGGLLLLAGGAIYKFRKEIAKGAKALLKFFIK